MILKASAQSRNKSLSFGETVSCGIAYAFRLFVASVLTGLIVGGLFFVFILLAIWVAPVAVLDALIWVTPMIYVGIRLPILAQASVAKDLGPLECLGESWGVTKGNSCLIFVIMIILLIVSAVIGLI